MDARFIRAALVAASLASLGAGYRTPNFVVEAPTPEIAEQIGKAAEQYRRELAMEWLGKAMPTWSQPCPITAQVSDHLGAGGATSFVFDRGEVFGWKMQIQGPLNRVLDSVLPHEVTHSIFASHFRRPLPRWADEGACTTVEHTSERVKQQKMLISFLRTGRGIPFSQMFVMKEYPHDIMPLYAQGHSLASYLVNQGGKRKFLEFVRDGLEQERWTEVTRQHYGYESLASLQNTWLEWVKRGSPSILSQPSAGQLAQAEPRPSPEPNLIFRGQSADRPDGPRMPPAPAGLAANMNANLPGPADANGGPSVVTEGWHAPTTKALASEPSAAPATPTASTNPQRQVLLEWNRAIPASSAGETPRTAATNSIYAPRASAGGTLLR
jgi:hypothetical protein